MMYTFLCYAQMGSQQWHLGAIRTNNAPSAIRWARRRFTLLPENAVVHAVKVGTPSASPQGFADPELARRAAQLAQSESVRAKRAATLAKRREAIANRTPGQRAWWDNKRRRDRGRKGNGPHGREP